MRRAALILLAALSAPAGLADCLIRGQVVDTQTGKPIAGARVLAKPRPRLSKPAIQRFSDNQGAFCFDALDAGRYQLGADHAGYLSATSRELAVGGPPIVMKMSRNASISGMVLDSTGEPLEGADVVIWRKIWDRDERRHERDEIMRTATDDRGIFRLAPLAAGNYYLGMKRHAADLMTLYGGNSLDHGFAIALSTGQNVEDLRLTIMDKGGRSLTARLAPGLKQGDKASLVARRLELWPDSSDSFPFLPEGTVSIDNLFPGRYRLQTKQVEPPVTAEVDLADHDIQGLVLEPTTLYPVQVIVNGPSDLKNVTMMAYETHTRKIYELEHGDGGFSSNGLPAGEYRLSLTGEVGYLKSLVVDGEAHSDTVLDLRTVRPKRVLAVFSPNMAKIGGHVSLGDDDLRVAWLDEAGFGGSRELDVNGAFVLPKLAPGKYRLYAIEALDDDLWGAPDLAAALREQSVELEVKEGDDRQVNLPKISAAEFTAALRKAGM